MPPLPSGAAFTPAPPQAPVAPPAPSAQAVESFSQQVDQALFVCAQGSYPPQASLMGFTGTGIVHFIYANSRAHKVKLVTPTAHMVLNRAILRAVRHCSLPQPPNGFANYTRSFTVEIQMLPPGGG